VDPEANIIVGSTLDTEMEGGMRVSVVATGIDASEKSEDVPVARRSMSAPLTRTVSAEDSTPEQIAADEAPAEDNIAPTLFESIEDVEFNEGWQDEQPAAEQDDDGLPPPAYQPQVAQFEPQPEVEETVDPYDAPRAQTPGTPSPEAMQRLQAAVQKVPSNRLRPTPEAPREPAPQPQQATEDRPRFGFNRLIDRMTGHAADTPAQPVRQQPAMRSVDATAPVQDEADPDQERIEIPAFLRRQAN
jgi:cell division protein FtsZ